MDKAKRRGVLFFLVWYDELAISLVLIRCFLRWTFCCVLSSGAWTRRWLLRTSSPMY